MSTFRAEVVKVEVRRHPDADRLDIVRPVGKLWQCVGQRDQFKTGDLAVYLPVDAVLPADLVTKLGIEKYYHTRLKTVRLRGYFSQGLVAPMRILPMCLCADSAWMTKEGADVTETLKITKYEEIIPVEMAGVQLPADERFVKYTNIENYKNYPDVFEEGEPVCITEKIHGTNARFAVLDGELHVGSHNTHLAPPREHTRWEHIKAFFGIRLPKTNKGNLYWRAAERLEADNQIADGDTVFGEIYGAGVQDLGYGMKPGEFDVAIFGVISNGKYLDDAATDAYCASRGWRRATVVYRGPWNAELVKLASGTSTLCASQMREGCVVVPQKEQYSERIGGRKILKYVSDEYLARKDATERH